MVPFLYQGDAGYSSTLNIYHRAEAKMKMARYKTDKVDAGIIAEYGAKFGGVSYAPTAENVKELRKCYRASLALKEQLICAKKIT